MSTFDDIQVPPSNALDGLWSGEIATTAQDADDTVEVRIRAFDDRYRFGPCKWMGRGGALPERGNECLVMFDERQRPFVVSFWPFDPDFDLPAGSVTDSTVALGSLEGRRFNWHEGSSPPASPQVNDLWLLHPVVGTSWLFRYEPDQNATYPWQFAGGSPWDISDFTTVFTNTVFSTWEHRNSPQFTVPRAGIYRLESGCLAGHSTAAWAKVHFGVGTAVAAATYWTGGGVHAGAGGHISLFIGQAAVLSGSYRWWFFTADQGGASLAGTSYQWLSTAITPRAIA